jgi:predicted dehydrogenase
MIGEGCHFIDLLRFLADSPIKAFHTSRSAESASADSFSFTLTFEDGSIGTVHYFGNGDRSFPKERVEVFCGGRILQLDNFRRLRGFGYPKFKRMNLWCQRKGAEEAAAAFVSALRERRPSPIPFPDILEVSRAAIDIAGAL